MPDLSTENLRWLLEESQHNASAAMEIDDLSCPLAEEVIRLRAEAEELRAQLADARQEAATYFGRINAALAILDDPDDYEDGICRATEALWGENPEVPPQIGGKE